MNFDDFVAVVVRIWQKWFLSFATYVRCGGKHDKRFIANFLLNSRLKEFGKLVNVRLRYARM